MFDQKKNRQGYATKLYNERPFKEFIEAANPYQFLAETNVLKISTDKCKEYVKVMKCPLDYDLYFEDLQVLGKKEIQQLIIWRNKVRSKIYKKEKPEKEEEKVENEEEYEERKMEEIDTEMTVMNRQRKKKLDAEKKKMEKNELRMKMTFINDQEHIKDDNGVEFDQNLFNLIRKEGINIEDLEYRDLENSGTITIPEQTVDEIDLSDLSHEEYYEMMNEDIEENMRLFEETKGISRKKKQRKVKEEKRRKEWNKQEEDPEKGNDDGIVYMKNDNPDEDLMDDDALADGEDEDEEMESANADVDVDSDEEEDSDLEMEPEKEDKLNDSIDEYLNDEEIEIENPLRKKKNQKKDNKDNLAAEKEIVDEENNLSSDTDEEEKKFIGKKQKRDNKALKKDGIDEDNKGIDVVPKDSDSEDEYDNDEIAEIRAIATKMLRKKDRLDVLYKTYNRFAFSDLDQAPGWFAEDENQHNVPSKPVTKDEINAQKEILKQVNDRMPKKVLEAKSRKKKKLQKRLDKVKKKAQVISNQDEINEFSKVKQIQKLYKKELNKSKEKKRYVVARSNKVDNRKDTRNVKHVDKRMKKDKRALKAIDKRKKKR